MIWMMLSCHHSFSRLVRQIARVRAAVRLLPTKYNDRLVPRRLPGEDRHSRAIPFPIPTLRDAGWRPFGIRPGTWDSHRHRQIGRRAGRRTRGLATLG